MSSPTAGVQPVRALIVGDCIMAPDDPRWDKPALDAALSDTYWHQQEAPVVELENFDPPMISPKPDICAMPVSMDTLQIMFSQVCYHRLTSIIRNCILIYSISFFS